jgi:Flp pilus assembly protein TadG
MSMNPRKTRQKGAEILEFALVTIPMFGFLFLQVNIAWAVFARASLQNAVREGVRYAVTSQTESGYGHKDSVKKLVQSRASFLLRGEAGWSLIHVRFFTPDTLTDVSNVAGGNTGGNLVQVSVEGYTHANLAPTVLLPGLLTRLTPIAMSADAWDRMEASPASGAPAL